MYVCYIRLTLQSFIIPSTCIRSSALEENACDFNHVYEIK